ncbi:MAG: hypothetical protein PV344_07075 [Anaplasma sp.]|nr:hypothetical protein [Anaplasma sp.]
MRQPLIRITSSSNHFHSTRDVTFHVSVVDFLNSRARSRGCNIMTLSTNPGFSRRATDAGFSVTRVR